MIKELIIEKTGLPVGWELTALGKVCEVIAGQSPESKFYNTNEEGLAFYQGKKDFSDKYIGQPTKWTTKTTKEAIKNDILMSVRAPVGPVNFSIQKCCIGRGLAAIRASEKIDKEYLYNFLVKFENEIEGNEGAVFNSINKSQIGAIPIPLPPLTQQKQIVAILDKAFAAIDTAKANAEQNLQNAKELFESYLQNVFENKNKGDDWEEKTIDEVTKVLNGHSFKSKDFSSENSVKSIKITNVGVKEFIQTEDNYLPSSFSGTYNKYRVHKGNLVIALTRTIISSGLKVAIVPDEYDNSLLNQRVAALIPKDVINDDYLYHFFCTKIVSDYVLSNVNPLMQPNLSITDLKKLLIPCPSIQEQKKVVQKLNDLTAQTKKLEAIYIQKIADLEEMKKSVLQKAFSGQLNTIN
jgi:type I restriction enzyme S subunit